VFVSTLLVFVSTLIVFVSTLMVSLSNHEPERASATRPFRNSD